MFKNLQIHLTKLFSVCLMFFASMLCPSLLRADPIQLNQFINNNIDTLLIQQNILVITLPGNVVNDFPSASIPCVTFNSSHTSNAQCISPFNHPNNLTVSYDSAHNQTLLNYSGDAINGTNQQVHAGFAFGPVTNSNGKLVEGNNMLQANWCNVTCSATMSGDLPIVNGSIAENPKTGRTGFLDYLFQFNGTDQWMEFPFIPGSNAKLTLQNPSSTDSITLSAQGLFFTTPTQIPLDQLNLIDLPPNNPQWRPVPWLPSGTAIPPGGTVTGPATTPEPASLLLFSSGLLGLAGVARRRLRQRGKGARSYPL